MNIIMSYFCFLLAQTASPFGHIARYAPSTTDTLPSTLDLWSLARARINSKI